MGTRQGGPAGLGLEAVACGYCDRDRRMSGQVFGSQYAQAGTVGDAALEPKSKRSRIVDCIKSG